MRQFRNNRIGFYMYKTIEKCRACGNSNLKIIIDLGNIFPSDFINGEPFIDYSDQAPKGIPLTLVRCTNCDLVQLLHSVDLDLMYRHYWYRSSINPSMRSALKDIVQNIEKRIELNPYDSVLDIGCNDGTMFDFYTKGNDLYLIGFDPARNLETEAKSKCSYFINDYFSSKYILPFNGRVKVITSIAMLYDLEDPNIFVEDIKKILAPDGLWVVQFTDLYSMFKMYPTSVMNILNITVSIG